MTVRFALNELMVGIHIPWVETNSFNERKLVNDLKGGKMKIAIACDENNNFNTSLDRLILKLKHDYYLRFIANLFARTLNRYIVTPWHFKKIFKSNPEYFLTYRKGVYSGDVPEHINKFVLVIFTTRDKFDSKVFCLPTNLNYRMENDELSGRNMFFKFPPIDLKELIFGKPWGNIEWLPWVNVERLRR